MLLRHPLQPYDARNLVPGALTGELSFSFDRASLAGAVAAAGPRAPRPPFLESALAEQTREDVSLADLKAFFTHPVRAFLKNRLDVSVPLEEEDVANAIPIEVRGLDKAGLRTLVDQYRDRITSGVVVLASPDDEGRVSIVVGVTADLTKKVPAGQVVKLLAPIVGGKGGGRPDNARGAGKDAAKIDAALAHARSMLTS